EDQFSLLEFLVPRCVNLKSITYEDPKFDLEGKLVKSALPSFERLKGVVQTWKQKRNSQISFSA
ncbi:MAG: hypothetical protein V4692_02680, partial [Bdellovibrionota bacterium]